VHLFVQHLILSFMFQIVCLQEVQADQLDTFYHQLNYLGKISVTVRRLVDVIHLTMTRVSLAGAHLSNCRMLGQ
jgi:hypothetical protein